MKILLLCEGDAESPHGSFSGTSYSIVQELRSRGHAVGILDVELRGWERWLAAGLSFVPDRRRWGARFRLGRTGFALRSRRARRPRVGALPDVVLQIGATFAPPSTGQVVLYCDSNIRMAERGRASGYSDAAYLSPSEVERIAAREASVYGGAAAILTISERLRRSFIEDFGIPANRVVAVHAGPNFAIPVRTAPRSQRTGPPTVLFVGKQFERKGGDLLLEAFRAVRERLPDARLVVVGPSRIPSAAGVECLGFLRKDDAVQAARLREVYEESDVFCLPTRYEPFGIAFLEAMVFSLPCVGPDAWAVPEIIADGRTGFTCPPEDPRALAERLLKLLSNPELARRLGEAGRRRAEEYFTWPATVSRMLAAIEPLMARKTSVA